jgi:hypothetical protein
MATLTVNLTNKTFFGLYLTEPAPGFIGIPEGVPPGHTVQFTAEWPPVQFGNQLSFNYQGGGNGGGGSLTITVIHNGGENDLDICKTGGCTLYPPDPDGWGNRDANPTLTLTWVLPVG